MKENSDLNCDAREAANAGKLLIHMLTERTKFIIGKLQKQDSNSVLKFFHKDMLLEKANAGIIIQGIQNISKTLARPEKLIFAARQYRFRTVLLEKYLAVITGSSASSAHSQDCASCPEACHLTLIWKKECDRWYLFYLHALDFSDASPKLILNGADGNSYAIREQQIQYIEARGKTSVLYLRFDGSPRSANTGSKIVSSPYGDGYIVIREGIRQMKDRLTSRFIWVHRSYIANINYVLSVRRYDLIMTGGVRIPIPAAKYTQMKAQILNLLRYLK